MILFFNAKAQRRRDAKEKRLDPLCAFASLRLCVGFFKNP